MGKIVETRELYKDTINDITKSEDNWLIIVLMTKF